MEILWLVFIFNFQPYVGDLVRHNQKFCRIFFDHIYETTKEFNHDFENKADSFSSLVVWVQAELKAFVEQFANQGF